MNDTKDISKRDRINCSGNHYAIYLHCKLEKITMATYMITDFFPDEEPLRNHLRERTIQLMSFVMSLTENPSSLKRDKFLKITSLITEIDSLFRISLSSNLISEMNYSIIIDEYKKFLELISKRKEVGVGHKVLLDSNFFKEDEPKEISEINSIRQSDKGQNIKDIKKVGLNDSSFNKIYNKKKKDKVDRKNLILRVIKDKKNLPKGQAGFTVKDISKFIKNCSEKTIQRELIAMVKSNTLKKNGERRWSHYSLK